MNRLARTPPALPWLLAAVLCSWVAVYHATPSRAAPAHPDVQQAIRDGRIPPLPPEPQVERLEGVLPGSTASGRRFTTHPRVLVLLVDFSDFQANADAFPPDHYRRLYFSTQETEFGSLRDYYQASSYGELEVTGEVHGWFRMPETYAFYANGQSGTCSACYPRNARGLIAAAIDAATNAGIDFRQFDNDGPDGLPGSGDDDRLLDGLLVVVPGSGSERTGNPAHFRSHYWDVTANRFVGEIEVPDYALVAGDENVGIAVHEFGHILGGEDLYDLSNPPRTNAVGDYSVMARAVWFNNARSPGGPDPFTRIQWGFATPDVIRADEPGLPVPRINDQPYIARLWRQGEAGPEYFLLENRARVGIDRFLPGEGILLYHIDETVLRQSNPARFRVSVVQADGLNSLNGGTPPNAGDPGDFLPGTLGIRELSDDTHPSLSSHDGQRTSVAVVVPGDPAPVMLVDMRVGVPLGGEPRPGLRIRPVGGLYASGLVPGPGIPLDLTLFNEGTRMGAGTLQFTSPDRRVRLIDAVELAVPRIGARGELALQATPLVQLESDRAIPRTVIPLVAEWTDGSATFRMESALPLESTVVARASFEEPDHAVTTYGLDDKPVLAWQRSTRSAAHGRWSWWTGGVVGYPANADEVVQVGPFRITNAAELRFRHLVSTQAFTTRAHDGGFLEISSDQGATWSVLEPQGGYPTTFTLTDGNAYPGQGAWAGIRGEWEEVSVPVVGRAGEVLFRFHFVSDFSASGGQYAGWFVDELLLRSWDTAYAGAVEWLDPTADPPSLDIRFRALVPAPGVAHLSLVRQNASGSHIVNSWPQPDQTTRDTVAIEDADPERVDAYHLEWIENGTVQRSPVLFSGSPTAQAQQLLGGTAAVQRRGEPGVIRYRVPGSTPQPVSLTLYDVRGRRLHGLVDELREPGVFTVARPDNDDRGRSLAAGVYFLRLEVGALREQRKLVLLH